MNNQYPNNPLQEYESPVDDKEESQWEEQHRNYFQLDVIILEDHNRTPATTKQAAMSDPEYDTRRSSKSKPPTRSVQWLDYVRVKRTHCIQDFSPEEKQSSWYTKEELRSIKSETRRIVKIMQAEEDRMSGDTPVWDETSQTFSSYYERRRSLDDRGICTRGLEYMTEREMKNRRHRILRGIYVVLDSQESKSNGCFYDENEPLACDDLDRIYTEVYAEFAYESGLYAHVVGLGDARFAQDYLLSSMNKNDPTIITSKCEERSRKIMPGKLSETRHEGCGAFGAGTRPISSHINTVRRMFFPNAA